MNSDEKQGHLICFWCGKPGAVFTKRDFEGYEHWFHSECFKTYQLGKQLDKMNENLERDR